MATLFPQVEPGADATIVNVASVRQISPFRYPGGKTWLVPTVSARLRSFAVRPTALVDPFAGGGSVPLGVLAEGLVDRIILGEIDPNVSSVWQCALSSQNEVLCRYIEGFEMSRDSLIREFETEPKSSLDRAFQTILKNRTYRGGILAPGASLMRNGENGRGVASRWYPETLVKRLRILRTLSPFIDFFETDAFDLIRRYQKKRDVVFFIDPPYTAGKGKRAGRRLYEYSELDHDALFDLLAHSAGLVLMTYDDCPDIIEMALRHGFGIERIAMKNTHHAKKFELLITNSATRA